MKEHAAILLQDDENKFLFVKRSHLKSTLPNIWAFPSGTVEEGESVKATAKREAKEELGVTVSVESVLGETEVEEFNVKLSFLICKILIGEPSIMQPEEFDEIVWMTMKDFYDKYSNNEIGHGLIWLRKNPELWKETAPSGR